MHGFKFVQEQVFLAVTSLNNDSKNDILGYEYVDIKVSISRLEK